MSNSDSATKQCAFCGETILAVAVKCKHCGSMIGPSPEAAIEAAGALRNCYFCKAELPDGAKVCQRCRAQVQPALYDVLARRSELPSVPVSQMSEEQANARARQRYGDRVPKTFWERWTVYPGLLLAVFGLFGLFALSGTRSGTGYFSVFCIFGIAFYCLFEPVMDAMSLADGSDPGLKMVLGEKERLLENGVMFDSPCCHKGVNFDLFRDGTVAQCPVCKLEIVRLENLVYAASVTPGGTSDLKKSAV